MYSVVWVVVVVAIGAVVVVIAARYATIITVCYLSEVLPFIIIIQPSPISQLINHLLLMIIILPQQRYKTLPIKWIHPVLITYPRS